MKFYRLVWGFVLFFSLESIALVGGNNSPDLIPKQLCQIVPIANGQFVPELSCSALAVAKDRLRTAGHCGYDFYHQNISSLFIDCYGGDKFPLKLSKESWTFFDSKGPLNPRLMVGQEESERIRYDVAEIKLPIALSYGPLFDNDRESIGEVIESVKSCQLVAAGTDEYMRWGIPQAKPIEKSKIVVVGYGTLVIQGEPYASGHDSGGALICDGDYVATIVAQKGKATILSSDWLTDQDEDLQVCSENFSSKAVEDSVQHLLGFTEVREFIDLQVSRGLKPCVQGLTLGKNAYQYYKNLIFVKFYNARDQIEKMSTFLFQVSSIQGHHSTEGRPWVAIDSSDTVDIFRKILKSDFVWGNGPSGSPIDQQFFGFNSEIEPSSLFLYSKGEFDFYVISWLKSVTSVNAGVHVSQVSPKYSIHKKNIVSGEVTLVEQSGAFRSILIPVEELLEESSKKVSTLNDLDQMDYLEELSLIQR